MKTKHVLLTLAIFTIAISLTVFCVANDEFEHHGKREHSEEKDNEEEAEQGDGHQGQTAMNSAYAVACGSCHWAYAPQLLPKKSWENMLASLGDHFGSEVTLSEQDKRAVANHLLSNAADVSSTEIGRKVMRSLRGATPSRVVEVHYILKKHRELAPEVFARKGVGGLANCIACHPGAGSLDFEDDRVGIPAQ
jgi:mono/diheme cytochrome c family protein